MILFARATIVTTGAMKGNNSSAKFFLGQALGIARNDQRKIWRNLQISTNLLWGDVEKRGIFGTLTVIGRRFFLRSKDFPNSPPSPSLPQPTAAQCTSASS